MGTIGKESVVRKVVSREEKMKALMELCENEYDKFYEEFTQKAIQIMNEKMDFNEYELNEVCTQDSKYFNIMEKIEESEESEKPSHIITFTPKPVEIKFTRTSQTKSI